jgi:hypothetical protein
MTGLSRRRSRVRVPSLPSLFAAGFRSLGTKARLTHPHVGRLSADESPALSLSHNPVRRPTLETPRMRGIEGRGAAAPSTAPGRPGPLRRSKENVSETAGRPPEVSASRAAPDKRDVDVQPILEDVAGRESHTGTRGQNPGQEPLRHQGVALGSRWSIDPAQPDCASVGETDGVAAPNTQDRCRS